MALAINEYSLSEIIKNIYACLRTRIFYPDARLIRFPFYLRGKKYFLYGRGLTTGYNCRFEMYNLKNTDDNIKIRIGINCRIGDNVHIAAGESVDIGANCLLASRIYISDIVHGVYSGDLAHSAPETIPNDRQLTTNPVKIGNNVWIGENVCILPGAEIGDGCIIAANAVVNKKFPCATILAGIPARIIKTFDYNSRKWRSVRDVFFDD